jgi:hypothetical protein
MWCVVHVVVCCGVLCCGVVWYGVWCGVLRRGLVWCGVVWCAMCGKEDAGSIKQKQSRAHTKRVGRSEKVKDFKRTGVSGRED